MNKVLYKQLAKIKVNPTIGKKREADFSPRLSI